MRSNKLTILTTTRDNYGELIATAASIKSQSSKFINWLVYDGSRTEEKLEIQQLVENHSKDFSTKFVHKLDNSLYEAMNNALKEVNTEYVLILNCGDLLYNNETINFIIEDISSSADIYHYSNIYVDCDHSIHLHAGSHSDFLINILQTGVEPYFPHMVCQQAIIYKASVLRKIPLNLSYPVAADHNHFIECKKLGLCFEYTKRPISIYFGGGFSWQHGLNCVIDWFRISLANIKDHNSNNVFHVLSVYLQMLNVELHNSDNEK